MFCSQGLYTVSFNFILPVTPGNRFLSSHYVEDIESLMLVSSTDRFLKWTCLAPNPMLYLLSYHVPSMVIRLTSCNHTPALQPPESLCTYLSFSYLESQCH